MENLSSPRHRAPYRIREPDVITMLSDRLNAAAAPGLAALRDALPFGKPGFGRYEYTQHLKRLYGFYAPWEIGLETAFERHAVDFYRTRRKRHLLEHDLTALGVVPARIAAIPQCRWLPPPETLPQALGALYAMERYRLDGQSRCAAVPACGYYHAGGRHAALRWRALEAFIASRAGSGEEETVCAAARDTLAALHDWLAGQELMAA